MASLQAERACLAAEEWIRTFGLAFILLQSPFPELWMLLQICRDPCGPALVPQTYLCLQRTDSSEFRAKAMCTCPGTLSVMPCLCAAKSFLKLLRCHANASLTGGGVLCWQLLGTGTLQYPKSL